MLVGCQLVPTSYTTNAEQKNLSKQNTLLQIELYRRYDSMDKAKKLEFLKQNVEFAMLMEQIICGKESASKAIFDKLVPPKVEDTKKEKPDGQ